MKNKKILTVYYSLSGHTAFAAKEIQAAAGGDIVSVEMEKPYSGSYFRTLFSAGFDILTGKKPSLKNKIDISGYDVIFAGGPVWWFTVTPPLASFLNGHDFAGKTLIPFCTQGSNKGKFFENFYKNAKNAKIFEGIDFAAKEFQNKDSMQAKLQEWIAKTAQQL